MIATVAKQTNKPPTRLNDCEQKSIFGWVLPNDSQNHTRNTKRSDTTFERGRDD